MTEFESTEAYVVCVGTSPEQTAAVARALEGRAVVVVGNDADAVLPLLAGQARQPVVAQPEQVADAGPLTIDRMLHQVTWEDQVIHLSPREFELLATLAADTGRVWTFEEIVTTVWKTRYLGDAEMVVSAVKRLRRRLAGAMADLRIVSVRGVGFRLVVPEAR